MDEPVAGFIWSFLLEEKQSVCESAEACSDFNLHSLVIRGRVNQEGQAKKEETEPLVCACVRVHACVRVRTPLGPGDAFRSSDMSRPCTPAVELSWTGGGGSVPVEVCG